MDRVRRAFGQNASDGERNAARIAAGVCMGILAMTLVILIIFATSGTEDATPIQEGPSPQERMVWGAMENMGGMPFNCSHFKLLECDGELDGCDALEEQEYRLCGSDGDPIASGPISECVCPGVAGPDSEVYEDHLVAAAIIELGYDHELVALPGNGVELVMEIKTAARSVPTIRKRVDAPWDLEMCRTRICASPECPLLETLRYNVCRPNGAPRINDDLGHCICDGSPLPETSPTECTPGQRYPLIIPEGRMDSVGWVEIIQGLSALTVQIDTGAYCMKDAKVYIGTTRPGSNPEEYSPPLPGMFPVGVWSIDIDVGHDIDHATFTNTDIGKPWEWNHPDAPIFECGYPLYLVVSAQVRERNQNGHCHSIFSEDEWEWAWAETSTPMSRYTDGAQGYLIHYPFCCLGACCLNQTCIATQTEESCLGSFVGPYTVCETGVCAPPPPPPPSPPPPSLYECCAFDNGTSLVRMAGTCGEASPCDSEQMRINESDLDCPSLCPSPSPSNSTTN